jgi:hypothetical protein
MTRPSLVLGTLLLLSHLHAAAADVEAAAVAKAVKASLKEVCKDDRECLKAVDEQFDACLSKSDFKKFIDASPAEEDRYLASTNTYLLSCIVNRDGKPYFSE